MVYQIKQVDANGREAWRDCTKHEYKEAGELNATRREVYPIERAHAIYLLELVKMVENDNYSMAKLLKVIGNHGMKQIGEARKVLAQVEG